MNLALKITVKKWTFRPKKFVLNSSGQKRHSFSSKYLLSIFFEASRFYVKLKAIKFMLFNTVVYVSYIWTKKIFVSNYYVFLKHIKNP